MGILLFMTTRGLFPVDLRLELFLTGVLAFLVVVGSWVVALIQGLRKTDVLPADASSDP